MNIDLKNYYSPTPKWLRKIGDTILLFGTGLTVTFSTLKMDSGWIITASVLTLIGKAVTNLFSEDPGATEKVTIEYPAEISGQITVDKEKVPAQP